MGDEFDSATMGVHANDESESDAVGFENQPRKDYHNPDQDMILP